MQRTGRYRSFSSLVFFALLAPIIALSCASLGGSNKDYSTQFVDSTFVRPKPVILAPGTGGIVGKVVDVHDRAGILGGNVQVSGTKIKAITDVDGSFVISNIPAGKYSIQVDAIGYTTLIKGGTEIKKGRFKHVVYKLKIPYIPRFD